MSRRTGLNGPDNRLPAFILYRQHHQASVISAHPGLANPQISKIIGEHWKQAPEEVKVHWKRLAEVSSIFVMLRLRSSRLITIRKKKHGTRSSIQIIAINLAKATEPAVFLIHLIRPKLKILHRVVVLSVVGAVSPLQA